MVYSDSGRIAQQQYEKLEEHFPGIELDVFQVMPNHVHGIIRIDHPVGARLAPALENPFSGQPLEKGKIISTSQTLERDKFKIFDENKRAGASPTPTAKTLGNIIGAYKSFVSHRCLELFKIENPDKTMGKLWQRNYHEHIIRNETSHIHIRNYIINNPQKWDTDTFFR